MKLRIGKRAAAQAKKIEQWWVEHRPSAPSLFTDELEWTFRYICRIPDAGVRWSTPRRPTLRRILMPRTKHHVYFVIDEVTNTIQVLSVWGAPRRREPKL